MIFTREDAIERMRNGQLAAATANYDISGLDDDNLWRMYQAAEKQIQRRLTILLEPTEIFPANPTSQELDDIDGSPYIVEPGYDLPADFFSTQKWGILKLREKPVIEVISVRLIYPNQLGTTFEIPIGWVHIDKNAGILNIIPSASPATVPLSMFMIQSIGAGHNIPYMLKIRYRAGLETAAESYPEIEDLILRSAVLRIIKGSFPGQSGSISADGLSESSSIDIAKFQEAINDEVDDLRAQIIGPIWDVL